MPGGLWLVLALLTGHAASAAPLTLELRVFSGSEDVSSQTRVAVHRAGNRSSPLVQIGTGHPALTADVPPGIYDVQAIRERDGRVLSIRWAERLVVMAYPDEAGRHLEVINFESGFGALQVRRGDGTLPRSRLFQADDHDTPATRTVSGSDYILFILPAGSYDLETDGDVGIRWHLAVEVPLDRTRLWIER